MTISAPVGEDAVPVLSAAVPNRSRNVRLLAWHPIRPLLAIAHMSDKIYIYDLETRGTLQYNIGCRKLDFEHFFPYLRAIAKLTVIYPSRLLRRVFAADAAPCLPEGYQRIGVEAEPTNCSRGGRPPWYPPLENSTSANVASRRRSPDQGGFLRV